MVASNFAFKPKHSDDDIGLAPTADFEASVAPEAQSAIEQAADASHEKQRQRLIAERAQREALQQQLAELRQAHKSLAVRAAVFPAACLPALEMLTTVTLMCAPAMNSLGCTEKQLLSRLCPCGTLTSSVFDIGSAQVLPWRRSTTCMQAPSGRPQVPRLP